MKRGTMEQKERKKYIRDLILVGALLIAALLVLLVIRNRQERETGTDAVVTVRTADGDEVYPLNKDGVFSLNGGTNTLTAKPGSARRTVRTRSAWAWGRSVRTASLSPACPIR